MNQAYTEFDALCADQAHDPDAELWIAVQSGDKTFWRLVGMARVADDGSIRVVSVVDPSKNKGR